MALACTSSLVCSKGKEVFIFIMLYRRRQGTTRFQGEETLSKYAKLGEELGNSGNKLNSGFSLRKFRKKGVADKSLKSVYELKKKEEKHLELHENKKEKFC